MTSPSISSSLTVRLELPGRPTAVSELSGAVERAGGLVTALDITSSSNDRMQVDVTLNARDTDHGDQIVDAMRSVEGVVIGKVSDRTFLVHLGGKLEVKPKVPIRNRDDLSLIYTPGVARVCMAIAEKPSDARNLTIKRNTVAVLTDGSAVLGLGDIGPLAALPVMEGKAALFKRFADIDAFVAETLGPLAAPDAPAREESLTTLRVLLDHNLNVAETARELFVHYNTLRYRIGRLEDQVGPFTTDPQLRLELALALRVLQVRGH